MAKLTTMPRRAGDLPPDEIVLAGPTDGDRANLSKVKKHRTYTTELVRPRSRQHEKWFRALVGVCADGMGRDPATLYAELKAKCGCFERVYNTEFGMLVELKSATKMSEAEYKSLTDRAIDFIFRDYLPDVARKSLFDEIAKMVGPRPK
jgi:hypothetical protein